MARSESLTVTAIAVESALAILRDEWGMTSPDSIDDPTMSPLWLEVWWRHFGEPGTEQVLCLTTGDGEPVGLLFTRLVVERYHGLSVRTVRCWTNSHAQRGNLILRCDLDAAARALAGYWVRNGSRWDLLRLHGLEPDFAEALTRHIEGLRCRCSATREWGHSRLVADQPWDQYFRTGLSRDTRREIDRMGRRLAELGELDWRDSTSDLEVRTAFAAFMDVEGQSWKREAGETIASSPALIAFYSDLMRSFAAVGMAAVSVLRLDGTPIAGTLGLATGRRLVTLKTSFDSRYFKYSPGSQLYKHVTAYAFNGGFKELDFYGKMPFSERWTKDERRFADLQIEGLTIRSRLVGLAWAAKQHWLAARTRGGATTQ